MRSLWRHFITPSLVGVLVGVFLNPYTALAERRWSRARFGYIEIVSLNEGAEVFLDGEQVGTVPLPEKIRVGVGEHSIKVSKRGFTQHLEVVRVKLRQTVTVEADLLALSGVLHVEANVENTRVFVDDDYIGNAPIDHEVEPGERILKLSHAGYDDFEQTVDIIAGERTEVVAELERLPPELDSTIAQPSTGRRWYERWWVWTIIGTVVVAAAIAIPVAISQQGDYCEDVAGWPSCDEGVITIPVQ